MEEYKRCPYCDEVIRFNALKCKHCGTILNGSELETGANFSPETHVKNALSPKYQLLEAVGRGGMASIYKAIQKNLNRIVALKIIHPNLIYDTEFVQRFHQEAHLCASLNHPNIVTIYDEGAINNVHFMAMEYLEGTDLQRIVKYKGRVIIEDAVKIIVTMANALDYAHNQGLVHRDIKSSNIIISREGRAILTDFGIAYAVNSKKLTQTGSIIGTPEYMSPEQAKGFNADGRSDLYSLGVVFFECLTGKVPFTSDNPITTILKIINDKPPLARELNRDIPYWLASIVNKLLEKDPDKRFQTGKELAYALANKKLYTYDRLKVKPINKKLNNKHTLNWSNYNTASYRKYYLAAATVILLFIVIIISRSNTDADPNYIINNQHKEENKSITILLQTADDLLNSGNDINLLNNNSAYKVYLDILNTDPENVGAAKGLLAVKRSVISRAMASINKRDYQTCISICDSGLVFYPNDVEIKKIKSEAELKLRERRNIQVELKQVKIPSVVGLQLSSARKILELRGFKVRETTIPSSADQKGLIINQIPGSGSNAAEGTEIGLVIGE